MRTLLAALAALAAVVVTPLRWVWLAGRWLLAPAAPEPSRIAQAAALAADVSAEIEEPPAPTVGELVRQAAKAYLRSTKLHPELELPTSLPLNVRLWMQSLDIGQLCTVAQMRPERLTAHLRSMDPEKIDELPRLKDERHYLPRKTPLQERLERRETQQSGKGSMRADKTMAEEARIINEILEDCLTPAPAPGRR